MLALKIDMSKYFDKVSWASILQALTQLGFNDHWTNMIHKCLSLMEYSILFNGTPTRHFKANRGIGQGNPLSLYHLIIYMETLSRIFQSKTKGKIHGYKVSKNNPQISHLLFTDVVFIFYKVTLSEAHELVDILELFSQVIGQEIYYTKSACYFNKTIPNRNKRMIKRIIKMKEMKGVEKYLGNPLFLDHTKG